MKKFLISAIVLLCISNPAFAWDINKMNEQVDQTNFVVNDNCSGTLVDKDHEIIITAAHCISSETGTVSQKAFKNNHQISETSYNYKLVVKSDSFDIALIHIIGKLPNIIDSKFACTPPIRGETEYAVGNPVGLYGTISKGIVSSIQRKYSIKFSDEAQNKLSDQRQDNTLIQITSPILPGSSGGAVYRDDGTIIGITTMMLSHFPSFAFAVPVDEIYRFFKIIGVAPPCQEMEK